MNGSATSSPEGASPAFSHLSVELGHLSPRDLGRGADELAARFRRLRPWYDVVAGLLDADRPRISTCVLIDDYFARLRAPAKVVPTLLEAADRAGLRVDYVVRESGLARAGETRLAKALAELLPVGGRTPSPDDRARHGPISPVLLPSQETSYRHSIFTDIELWDDHDAERTWSCALLAAVWQMLRLGLVGRVEPLRVPIVRLADVDLGRRWPDLPGVIQVGPDAHPLPAYQTLSVLPADLIPVEHAVRLIVSEASIETGTWEEIVSESRRDGVSLAKQHSDRIAYVFTPAEHHGE